MSGTLLDAVVVGLVMLGTVLFVWHCPILKPWFGFRKPPGHHGRWFE